MLEKLVQADWRMSGRNIARTALLRSEEFKTKIWVCF
jgi:hypothetical protein